MYCFIGNHLKYRVLCRYTPMNEHSTWHLKHFKKTKKVPDLLGLGCTDNVCKQSKIKCKQL